MTSDDCQQFDVAVNLVYLDWILVSSEPKHNGDTGLLFKNVWYCFRVRLKGNAKGVGAATHTGYPWILDISRLLLIYRDHSVSRLLLLVSGFCGKDSKNGGWWRLRLSFVSHYSSLLWLSRKYDLEQTDMYINPSVGVCLERNLSTIHSARFKSQ